jgi:hypothetical protein
MPNVVSRGVAGAALTCACLFAGPLQAEETILDKPFQVESGTIEFRKSVVNAAVTVETVETLYFKDWGRIQARVSTETSSNKYVKGEQVARKFFLMEGAVITTVDLDAATGTRMKNPMAENLGRMTRGQAEEMAGKLADAMGTEVADAGEAEVAGLPCRVTESVTNMGEVKLTTRTYLWNGIVLKVESSGMGTETREEALSVDVTTRIPEEKFRLPEGITIGETKMP